MSRNAIAGGVWILSGSNAQGLEGDLQ